MNQRTNKKTLLKELRKATTQNLIAFFSYSVMRKKFITNIQDHK